jgi:hypothetical protein
MVERWLRGMKNVCWSIEENSEDVPRHFGAGVRGRGRGSRRTWGGGEVGSCPSFVTGLVPVIHALVFCTSRSRTAAASSAHVSALRSARRWIARKAPVVAAAGQRNDGRNCAAVLKGRKGVDRRDEPGDERKSAGIGGLAASGESRAAGLLAFASIYAAAAPAGVGTGSPSSAPASIRRWIASMTFSTASRGGAVGHAAGEQRTFGRRSLTQLPGRVRAGLVSGAREARR